MKTKTLIPFLALIAFSSNASAYFIGGINLDGVYALENNNPEGNSTGYRAKLGLGYGYEQYFAGLKLGLGDDRFSGDSDATQGQTDIELNVGYRLNPMISAFMGYRNRSLDFKRTVATELKATETINHFGLGAAMNYPLSHSLIFKSDISAYYLNSQYKNDSFENSGDGYSAGISAGVVQTFKGGFNVNATAKLQATNTGYFTGGSYNEFLGGLSLGVAKVF